MKEARVVDIGDGRIFAGYQDKLIHIYKQAFGEPPWNEIFTNNEVKDWFAEMMSCSGKIVLALCVEYELIGGTFCVNADLKHDVWQYLPTSVKKQEVIYLAESFINPAYQRKGLGKILHDRRLEIARKQGYKYALQRTNEQSGMYALIQRTCFKEIGRQIVISCKTINGVIKEYPDERVISLKKL